MEELNGKVIDYISGCNVDSGLFVIKFEDGTSIEFFHNQSCCERVYIEDVNGNPDSHAGATLYGIDVKSNSDSINPDLEYSSYTWTFYTIRTSKGYLDVRWFGGSNGYYSENVDYKIF